VAAGARQAETVFQRMVETQQPGGRCSTCNGTSTPAQAGAGNGRRQVMRRAAGMRKAAARQQSEAERGSSRHPAGI